MQQVMNWDYLNEHPELVAQVRKLAANEGRHANWYNANFFILLYHLPDDLRAAFQFMYRSDRDISNVIEFIRYVKREVRD